MWYNNCITCAPNWELTNLSICAEVACMDKFALYREKQVFICLEM